MTDPNQNLKPQPTSTPFDVKITTDEISSSNTGRQRSDSAVSNSSIKTNSSLRLKPKLSRNPSSASIDKDKAKLKLHTLQSFSTTPVLLSPRGTPMVSPDANGNSLQFEFFPGKDNSASLKTQDLPSHLDILLGNEIDKSDFKDENTIIIQSPDTTQQKQPPQKQSQQQNQQLQQQPQQQPQRQPQQPSQQQKMNFYSMQTKLQRMPSASSNIANSSSSKKVTPTTTRNPRSPLNQIKKGASNNSQLPNSLSDAVRPHSSILKNNLNTRFTQQYQQQEKLYLTGITKYRNRYKNDDDYYDKTVTADDYDETPTDSLPEVETDVSKSSDKIESDLLANEDSNISIDQSKELQALRVLSQQIGITNDELGMPSEYTLDSNVLLDLLNKNDDIQFQNSKDNANISERLEWQSMLQSVLTGDVVTGEKTKLIKPLNEMEGESFLRVTYKEDLWLGIRAKLFGRTDEDQKRLVLYHRGLVDETLEEIMNFKLDMTVKKLSYADQVKHASEKANDLLDKYARCQELWRTLKEMETDKPQCASPEFKSRINCLVSWTSVTGAIERESNVLKKWVGNDQLDILQLSPSSSRNTEDNDTKSSDDTATNTGIAIHNNEDRHIFKDDRSFVERVMKDKDIEDLFNKRLFATFSHWTMKAKKSYLEYHTYFEELGLPSYLDNLFVLTTFPSKLMKEIIKARISYAKKLKNPTMMMIDQVLDDLKMYLKLALEIRISFLEYCSPVEGWISFPDFQNSGFDSAIIECIHHYFFLMNRKLLYSPKNSKSFRTFKEPDELEKEWFLLQNCGFYLEGGSTEIATEFSILTTKLITRLSYYLQNQLQGPPSDGNGLDKQNLIRWYTSSMENFGQLRRKFLRFSTLLNQYFQNCVLFNLVPSRIKKFFSLLKESNHALYHSAKLAEEGVYIFVSEALVNRPNDVEAILKATRLGVDLSKIPQRHLDVVRSYNPQVSYYSLPEEFDQADAKAHHGHEYVLVIVPPKAMMWDGAVIPFNNLTSLPISELETGKAMLITNSGPDLDLEDCVHVLRECVGDTAGNLLKKGCSLPKVEKELQIMSKLLFRMSCFAIDASTSVRNICRGIGDCQELVNTVFMYVRDLGRDSIRYTNLSRRSAIILRLMQTAIEWLSFIVDDCVPTDPRTFRWSVAALEFAMDVTRGFNILTLDSQKFYRLKEKVAACMSLLIAHFDIMGARAKALQRTRMLNYSNKSEKDIYTMDDESLGSLREHIMSQIKSLEDHRRVLQVEQQSVGRVLDNRDMENQLLTYLASSFSSVSIRWQKGKFLGGGTFGSVYASINLDTGGPMAVKEIRFQDRQSIKTIVPAIKGEMSVLEMLSHPNIVQFFGVEVHRDRVYIFMEYCSGGSLASLLEYGRIEDEAVIQLYTLQMLEGLAYLHQFGIVHRDVKPDNILLDHMGVIKYVDFGSAKVIAINGGSTSGTGSTTSSATTTKDDSISSSTTNFPSGSTTNTSSATSTYELPPVNIDDPSSVLEIASLVQSRKSQGLTGTPMYMSPETIKGDNPGKFGAVDIWSLGCCILEMATGRRPWSNLDNEYAVMYHIAAGHLPQFPSHYELSLQGQEFLAKCLTIDPYKRLSAVELLQDPWIQAIRNETFSDNPAAEMSSESLVL